MQAKEALDVLALRPGATSAEVKQAYRDLVKVWHPDRFGEDQRLREKAEGKLKEINEAYELLQREPVPAETYSASYESSKSAAYRAAYGQPSAASQNRRRKRVNARSTGVRWVYLACGAALVFLGILYLYLNQRPAYEVETTRTPVAQNDSGNAPIAPVTEASDGRTSPKMMNRAGSLVPKQYRVRTLSEAETMRLESACSPLRGEDARYRECVKAQLALITNATAVPDLSSLNAGERASIDSVCIAARGADAYGRCLAVQMAAVTSEPVRPDLSNLNETDRSTAEFACRNPKYREGPAAYDRCLVRTLGLLERTK